MFSRRQFTLLGAASFAAACAAPRSVEALVRTPAWEAGPDLPRPAQEIYPALHDGEIWLAGGFVARDGRIVGPTNETVVLNPASGTWRDGPGIPTPRHHPHLQSHAGKLYAFGGFEALSADAMWNMQKSGWRLDTDGWNVMPDLPMPVGEAVTASLASGLHVVGGRTPAGPSNRTWNDQTDTGHHYVFDGERWQTAAPLPTPRNSATAEMLSDGWHVVGGRTVEAGNQQAHEVYDLREDRWRSAAPLPQAQAGLASGVIDGRLYAFGGEFFEGEGGVYAETWVYDTSRDHWEAGPPMRTPRHGLGGVTFENQIYAIGGAKQRSGVETSALVEILS
ncbi:Kelch repeat-containing protein [Ponticaulis profundi]|uniref:Kelch repeat-containing protein n=1 Tax=Ponticaulis profundi TaxID=2665222 RepID=A0ABW1S7G9_9PROT